MSASEQNTTACRTGSIVSVQVGHVAPLGPRQVPSAFVKKPISGRVMVERLGLVGDQQADPRAHGGPDKAVYCYPIEHYAKWSAECPSAEALLVPGGFGENLTTLGFDEDGVCIGDIMRIGSVTAQVTRPRTPCFKLGLRFADVQMLRAMTRSGRSGWYLRVLEPGLVEAGALITTMDRLNPSWPIARLNRLIRGDGRPDEIAELASLRGIAKDLRLTARDAIKGST
jgi:MOSC domain-containing protein YiiM